MCGLVGVAGNIDKDLKRVFSDALVLDTVRGPHSTGVMSVCKKKVPEVLKKTLLPHDLMSMKQWSQVVTLDSVYLMGHNRWATQGKVNSRNAHPFEVGSLIGAHNGTLKSRYNLPDHTDFEVDSENLIHAINELGWEEAIKLANGAYALTVYNKDDHTLSMIRNNERPLFFSFTEDGRLVYASEDWMISVACARNGVAHKKIINLPEMELVTFKLPDKTNEPVKLVTNKKLKGYVAPPAPTYNNHHTSNMYARSSYPKYNGSSTSYSAVTELGGHKVGDEVWFYPIEFKAGDLIGCTEDSVPTEVRVHISKHEADFFIEEEKPLSAKVMSIARFSEYNTVTRKSTVTQYLRMNPNVAIEEEEEEEVEVPRWCDVTKSEWNWLTSYGCCVCSTSLKWGVDKAVFDQDAAFCTDCWAGLSSTLKLV